MMSSSEGLAGGARFAPPSPWDLGRARKREEADAYRDQELARLFERSEWSHERIALKLKKGRRWVSYHLLFGRFLTFGTARSQELGPLLSGLTEYVFRQQFYKDTQGREEQRFAQALDKLKRHALLVAGNAPLGVRNLVDKPGICAAMLEALADEKWHAIKELNAIVEGRPSARLPPGDAAGPCHRGDGVARPAWPWPRARPGAACVSMTSPACAGAAPGTPSGRPAPGNRPSRPRARCGPCPPPGR